MTFVVNDIFPQKRRLNYAGMTIVVENFAGSIRNGTNSDGSFWSIRMSNPYGYISDSVGADGDQVDCYIGPDPDSKRVFIVHQNQHNNWGEYDEDKVMLAFPDRDSAVSAYLNHYDDPRFLGDVTEMSLSDFKRKVMRNNGGMIKSLIDLSDLSCDCENDAMEYLSKAMSEDQHDIWAPHENPFISKLIEQFTAKGLLRIDSVKRELSYYLERSFAKNVNPVALLDKPKMAPVWTSDELSMVKLYLENLPSSRWTLDDYDYLVQYVFQRHSGELMTEAEWLVTRAHLSGKVEAHLSAAPAHVIDLAVSSLPSTVASAVELFHLMPAEQGIMNYARLHAADLVVDLSDSARHAIKRTVLSHVQSYLSGDPQATPGKLQQQLFDHYAGMNRDWRRIALTEAGESCGQGVVASLAPGAVVKRFEMYKGACGFCKKIDGMQFTVVSPDKPDKNDWTEMWVGKTNVGRSSSPYKKTADGLVKRTPSELWVPVPGTIHPHCRGRLILQSANHYAKNPEFARWLENLVGEKQ